MPISRFVCRSLPAIAFLPPLTPSQLRDFFATTGALSPPKRGSSGSRAMNSASPLVRDPRFTSQQLPSILPPTIPDDPFRARAVSARIWRFSCPPLSGAACAFRASPFTRRLAVVCDRIEFIIVLIAGWLFASGCSPPHLSVMQLPSATEIQLSPIGTFTQLLLCACGRTSAGILPAIVPVRGWDARAPLAAKRTILGITRRLASHARLARNRACLYSLPTGPAESSEKPPPHKSCIRTPARPRFQRSTCCTGSRMTARCGCGGPASRCMPPPCRSSSSCRMVTGAFTPTTTRGQPMHGTSARSCQHLSKGHSKPVRPAPRGRLAAFPWAAMAHSASDWDTTTSSARSTAIPAPSGGGKMENSIK